MEQTLSIPDSISLGNRQTFYHSGAEQALQIPLDSRHRPLLHSQGPPQALPWPAALCRASIPLLYAALCRGPRPHAALHLPFPHSAKRTSPEARRKLRKRRNPHDRWLKPPSRRSMAAFTALMWTGPLGRRSSACLSSPLALRSAGRSAPGFVRSLCLAPGAGCVLRGYELWGTLALRFFSLDSLVLILKTFRFDNVLCFR